MGDYAKGLAACEAALPVLQGNDRDAANAYNVMGGCHLYMGDYDKALECYGRSLAARERAGELVNVAASLNNIGVVLGKKGDLKRALEHHERSMRIKEKVGDRLGLSFSYNNIGNLHWNRGEMELAAEFMAKGLENSGLIGDRWGVASSHNNLGNVEYDRGRFAEALEHYRMSLQIRERIGDREGVSWSHNNMGNVLTCLGDLEAAMRHHETAQAISQEIGDREGIAWSHNNIGAVSLELGDLNRALEMHAAGTSIAREIGVQDGILDGLLGTAETLLAMGRAAEAKVPSDEGLVLSADAELKHARLRALRVSARVSEKLGDWISSEEYFSKSLAEAADAGTVTERAYTLFEYGKCLRSRGDMMGTKMLEEACAFFHGRGMRRWAERCARELETVGASKGKAAG
jgi:tetratricopeptide (TPR) repeat protein